MDLLKILRAFLSNVYKMTDGEIDALVQASENNTEDTAIATLLARDQTRVSELMKPRPGSTFQDGYAKAKGEVLTQLENELKTKYNLTTDAKGLDLIQEAITAQSGQTGGAKLSDDEVRKHPIFQQFERDMRKQLKEKDTEMQTKLTELENNFKKNEILTEVNNEALKILEPLKPVFPGTPAVASTLKNKFLEEFKGFDYEKQADGRFLVTKGGVVQTNAHGHSLYLDDLVKATASNYFEFQQNNGGSNANNGGAADQKNNTNGGGNAGYPNGIKKPTTEKELYDILDNIQIPATDRKVVLTTWEAEQTGQKV